MKKLTLALLACLLALAPMTASAGHEKTYRLADVKALVDQGSWAEAVAHLADIPPSERKADWQDLAGKAAVGYVGTGKNAMEKLGIMVSIEGQFPIVIKNDKYAALRVEVAPDGFADCFARSGGERQCLDYATKFVEGDPTNGKLTLAIAKTVRRGMHSSNAIPMFKRAATTNKPDVLCKDFDLAEAIWSAFDWYDRDPAADARDLAKTCWADVRKRVLKDPHDFTRSDYRKNTCDVMRAKSDADVDKLCAAATK